MITVGPRDIDAMTFADWVALLKYTADRKFMEDPYGLLEALADAPQEVPPEDLADLLDDLWDTNPPEEIKSIIAGVLRRLQEAGVMLAKRDTS
jgi:hypothetical protein